MKYLLAINLAFSAIFAVAIAKDATDVQDGTSSSKAAVKERMLQKSGGMLERKGEGIVAFVNVQNKILDSEISEVVDYFHRVLKFSTKILRASEWNMKPILPEGAGVAIYIIDDPGYPMSLIAPESHWGMVNTAYLRSGMRFSKEMTRVITLTCGAGLSTVKTSPMQPVSNEKDLDKLTTYGYTFDSATAIIANLKSLGITQGMLTSYRRACEQGWAPAPTNNYQQAIWDQVHAIPANPMKIEFDPKKGR